MRISKFETILILGALLFSACDSAPGIESEENSPPVLSNLSFTPESVQIDELPGGTIQDGIAQFSLDVSVDAVDPDGNLDKVFIVVTSPIPGRDPLITEEMAVSSNGRIEREVVLRVPVAEIGVHTVKVFASDARGALGNQVVGSLIVDAVSEPPVIVSIQIPERVTRPAPGEPAIQIPIVADVSDPDGLANILSVEVEVNGSSTFQLCDDGGASACNAGFPDSGDVTAGDGLFTLTITLDSSNSLGDNVFVFTATDRAGLTTQPVSRTITVE